MRSDWIILTTGALLGGYGVWAVRRDIKRGRASARGLSFDKKTQPKRYLALTAFNCFAVGLLLVGAVIQSAVLLWRLFSN